MSALPVLARALAVSIEELIGETTKPAKRGPTPKLQQQLDRNAATQSTAARADADDRWGAGTGQSIAARSSS